MAEPLWSMSLAISDQNLDHYPDKAHLKNQLLEFNSSLHFSLINFNWSLITKLKFLQLKNELFLSWHVYLKNFEFSILCSIVHSVSEAYSDDWC